MAREWILKLLNK